jgi:hypothetical protein
MWPAVGRTLIPTILILSIVLRKQPSNRSAPSFSAGSRGNPSDVRPPLFCWQENRMALTLRPVADQVIVITGASSGIGLVTARTAARRGATVVLAARNEQALRTVVDEIRAAGGTAAYVVADVGREEDVQRIAETAIAEFGRFDTWVNNAGVSIFGNIMEVSTEDLRRVFDTVLWGVAYGSRTAVAHFRHRGGNQSRGADQRGQLFR